MGIFKWMMRTGASAPGGTARVMTNNYYSLFFTGQHTEESAYALLNFRNMAYLSQGLGLSDNLLKILSENYYDDITILIFCMSYYDNFHKENQRQMYIKEMDLIYEVIVGEYNKLCPINERINASNVSKTRLMISLSFINDYRY